MSRQPDSVEDLARRYREVLLEMGSDKVEPGGHPSRWNRLVYRMQTLHLQLKTSEAGRLAISALIHDDVMTVRLWSATNALAWDPIVARAELERQAKDDSGLTGFEARMTLREYDAGRLNTDWLPKGRR